MTTWIEWVTALPFALLSLIWLPCVCARQWVAVWVLLYVERGLTVLAGLLYAMTGHPRALIPFGLLYLVLWGAHWLFPPTGPRELGKR